MNTEDEPCTRNAYPFILSYEISHETVSTDTHEGGTLVGTDLSRPFGLLTFKQGRDKSVPTDNSCISYKTYGESGCPDPRLSPL